MDSRTSGGATAPSSSPTRAAPRVLRGGRAEKFLAEVESGDAQLVMARWTGAYRFGNERQARNHPRNQGGRTGRR